MSNTKKHLDFYFITLFPEALGSVLRASLLGKAAEKGIVSYNIVQLRDFSKDKHKAVDDAPFGGGGGMLLCVDVLHEAWKKLQKEGPNEKTLTVLLSPQGPLFSQTKAKEYAQTYDRIILVCGHYEGVDERFIELCVDEEVSIGDYILTGGEIPALVIAETVTRLLPGVIGNDQSVTEETLERGLLKYPQYTRPREYMGLKIPDVLLSGNHEQIAEWRIAQQLERTARKRPDLYAKNIKK